MKFLRSRTGKDIKKHRWFAWFPVYIWDDFGGWAWLEWVDREYYSTFGGRDGSPYEVSEPKYRSWHYTLIRKQNHKEEEHYN